MANNPSSNKRVMVLGIPPTYEYTGHSIDRTHNIDYYAANAGGSLIANALCQIFDGEFVYDTSDINKLNEKYDACVLSLATHLDPHRDASRLAEIVEKLDMPVMIPAVGITAYEKKVAKPSPISPSFRKLLSIVSEKSEWIGVRGHYSANVLLRNGFKNIVPIGCPTIFRELNRDLKVEMPNSIDDILFVYHFTAHKYISKIKDIDILGQDLHDHFVFTDELDHDHMLRNKIYHLYGNKNNVEIFNKNNKNRTIFYPSFKKWYKTVLDHDFVLGPRLHGCLAAIGKGKPAVFVDHDLRIREVAEFFGLPVLSEEFMYNYGVDKNYLSNISFNKFHDIYPSRFDNFIKMISENKIPIDINMGTNNDFIFKYRDGVTKDYINSNIAFSSYDILLDRVKDGVKNNNIFRPFYKMAKFMKNLRK